MKSLNQCIIVASLLAGSIAGYGQTSLVGEWHGTDNNLPTVDLNIEQDAGQATGSAVFYMIKRNSDGGTPYVFGQASGPMENLNYAPEKLTFDMHRKDRLAGQLPCGTRRLRPREAIPHQRSCPGRHRFPARPRKPITCFQ